MGMQTVVINGKSYRVKEIPEEKRCGTCGEVKKMTDFYNNKCRPDGKSSECKSCVRIRIKNQRERLKPTKTISE